MLTRELLYVGDWNAIYDWDDEECFAVIGGMVTRAKLPNGPQVKAKKFAHAHRIDVAKTWFMVMDWTCIDIYSREPTSARLARIDRSFDVLRFPGGQEVRRGGNDHANLDVDGDSLLIHFGDACLGRFCPASGTLERASAPPGFVVRQMGPTILMTLGSPPQETYATTFDDLLAGKSPCLLTGTKRAKPNDHGEQYLFRRNRNYLFTKSRRPDRVSRVLGLSMRSDSEGALGIPDPSAARGDGTNA